MYSIKNIYFFSHVLKCPVPSIGVEREREIQLMDKTFNLEQRLKGKLFVHLLLEFYITERKVGKLVRIAKCL